MKKNISINISGIIFHIEEDGYEALRRYLDSINRYFGTFEDSSEILADIESRIAEIFLSKLNDGKQIITSEDVQQLIATMGSVNDFKAAEEQEATGSAETTGARSQPETEQPRKESTSKRLVRDEKRKILGGVCAGLGHYFNVDAVWPRLLFALLIFATFSLIFVLYIILWIVLPSSSELDESTIKKMFRDPDNKVVGGVASGVAAFFGADTTLIRVLFVIFTVFFGTGFLVYIILWMALPQAKTITDKMKMQGEPVTLSNIESSIKKGINEKDGTEESTFTKIILFPFRMIAAVLTGIGNILGPLIKAIVDIFRIAMGLVISATGVIFLISIVLAGSVWFGALAITAIPEIGDFHSMNLPLEPIRQAFPTLTIVAALLAAAIPAIYLILLGNSIIVRKIVFHQYVGWGLFALFIVCVVMLSINIPRIIYTFKEEADVKVENNFPLVGKKLTLKIKEVGLDGYKVTRLYLRGYEGKDIKLVQHFESRGSTKMTAKENAQMIEYHVVQQDSSIVFDSNVAFKKDARFFGQTLSMDLYLPYDQPFAIDADLWAMIQNHWRGEYNGAEETREFKVTQTGKLECLSCPVPEKDMSGLAENDKYGIKDFDEIEMTGAFEALIQEGDEFGIQLEGPENQKKLYSIERNGSVLNVRYSTRNREFWKDGWPDQDLIRLTITLPHLVKLNVRGAGKLKMRGFDEPEMKLSFTGAMEVDARMSSAEMSLDLTGPVVFEIDGHGDFLEANLKGIAQLKATQYPVNRSVIDAKGVSQAKVNVSQNLEIDKDLTSNVRYTGNPGNVEINGKQERDQN